MSTNQISISRLKRLCTITWYTTKRTTFSSNSMRTKKFNQIFFLVKFSYLRKIPVAGSYTRSRLSCSNSFSTTMERSNPVAEAIEYTGICAQAQILLVSEPPNFGSCISFFTELKLWVMHLIFLSYQVSKHSLT